MGAWLGASWDVIAWTVVSTVVIYGTVLVATRISGLRSFAKLSSFDFAATVATGTLLASTAVNRSIPVAQGVAAVGAVFLLQAIVAWSRRNPRFRAAADNTPRVLMAGSRILHDQLRSVRLSEDELRAALRSAGVIDPAGQVLAVIMETTGDLSVLTRQEGRELDPSLLQDVRGRELLAR